LVEFTLVVPSKLAQNTLMLTFLKELMLDAAEAAAELDPELPLGLLLELLLELDEADDEAEVLSWLWMIRPVMA